MRLIIISILKILQLFNLFIIFIKFFKMFFQDIIQNLNLFWSSQGCLIMQPYDTEKGAGTMNPHTFLRAIGPEHRILEKWFNRIDIQYIYRRGTKSIRGKKKVKMKDFQQICRLVSCKKLASQLECKILRMKRWKLGHTAGPLVRPKLCPKVQYLTGCSL